MQIIEEASSSMHEAFAIQHSEVPWQDIADFRNILVHEYFRVDTNIVWLIVERELPELERKTEKFLRELEATEL